VCGVQGMDGMVKHPSTRKEQAYVIALGGETTCCLEALRVPHLAPKSCVAVKQHCCAFRPSAEKPTGFSSLLASRPLPVNMP
jgi:hypothetical protein